MSSTTMTTSDTSRALPASPGDAQAVPDATPAARRISLSKWLRETYGEDGPTIETARRWAREGRIHPAAERHGRDYYVVPDATYDAAYTQTRERGFSLIELMIVMAVIMAIAVISFSSMRSDDDASRVRTQAAQLKEIGGSVSSYIGSNTPFLAAQASTDVPLTAACTTAAGNPATGVGLQCPTSCGTTACLAATSSTTTVWGSGYSLRINRVGAVAPFQYEALLVTNTGWQSSAGVFREDLAGAALRESGAMNAGMTRKGAPGTLSGRNAGYSVANPFAGATPQAAVLGFYVSPSVGANLDGTYLRIDGGNQMAGPLRMNENPINSAASLTTRTLSNQTAGQPLAITSNVQASGDLSTGGSVLAGWDVLANHAVQAWRGQAGEITLWNGDICLGGNQYGGLMGNACSTQGAWLSGYLKRALPAPGGGAWASGVWQTPGAVRVQDDGNFAIYKAICPTGMAPTYTISPFIFGGQNLAGGASGINMNLISDNGVAGDPNAHWWISLRGANGQVLIPNPWVYVHRWCVGVALP
jgi:prepilin-type N-terminal cleavage/methylation domain-containing protein